MATGTGAPVDCVWPAQARLGEGPIWDADAGLLHWIDIKAGRLHRFEPATGNRFSADVGEEIGAVALRASGGLIAVLRSGFANLDMETGEKTPIIDPESDTAGNRFNDGAVDAAGRFWAGTMDDAEQDASGALYRLDGDGRVTRLRDGFVISNGIGWSPDGGTMYFTDSTRQRIVAYDFDPASGDIGGDRTFVQLGDGGGFPDGLTVDAEGGVWSALWDGHRLMRFTPEGELERSLPMPVPRPTSMAFGGDGLGTLYITSARIGLDEGALSAAPLSGGLFAVDTGIKGLSEHRFRG